MTANRELRPVTDERELRELLGEPPAWLWQKNIARIDGHARTIIEHSPFVLLATAGADGTCDVTPRGDPPGSVLVLDEHTLVLADRPGNHRLDSLRNVLANPWVGLLFVVPGMNETLRVNGRGTVVSDGEFFDRLRVRGKRPTVALVIEVTELFAHCAKAFVRSGLWRTDTWPDRSELPTLGQMLRDQVLTDRHAPEVDELLDEDIRTNQY